MDATNPTKIKERAFAAFVARWCNRGELISAVQAIKFARLQQEAPKVLFVIKLYSSVVAFAQRPDRHRTSLVGGLTRMRVKRRAGELVRYGIVHRDKDLAGLYRICDKSRRGHLAPARYDLNRLVCADPEPLGVERIELYVDLFRIQFAEYARFSRPGLGVPLGRRAAASEQSERIFCVGRLRQFARSFEQESRLSVGVVENTVFE
jgi:hypothetical protein